MTINTAIPTRTTTVAELLEMGAKISFRSGRSMKGDLDGRYIAVSNEFGPLGVWDMDARSGVDDAVSDLDRDARETGCDLHGNEIVQHDDVTEDLGDDGEAHVE